MQGAGLVGGIKPQLQLVKQYCQGIQHIIQIVANQQHVAAS